MLTVTLIVAGWGVLALLLTSALVRVCRSGEVEDRNRRYGGDREVVPVQAGVPAPRSASPDTI